MRLLGRRLRLFFVSSNESNNKGFTVVELIVTISILVIVTTLIFANYPKFRENISLKKTAQETALAVRQAQTYGLGVREFQPGTGIFPGYGVHFNITSSDSFILFADLDEDNVYDGVSENVESFKIQTGEKLSGLCANVKTSPPGTCGFNTIDIIFFRPKPLVTIKADGSDFFDAEIKIISPRGQIKTIVILSSGQISVE
jgi:prepilin-type N-terminal cleavage/methylation domain-containing protein